MANFIERPAKPLPARRLLPSLKLCWLLALGAALFAMGGLFPDVFWLGLLYNLGLGGVVLLETQRVRNADRVEAKRDVTLPLSLGAANLVTLRLYNRSTHPLELRVRDEAPHEFVLDQKELTGTLDGLAKGSLRYHITPLERGRYAFGALNIRFASGWGLLILQRRFGLEQEVKVYPDVLETKKHQLLARRHHINDMGHHSIKVKGGGMEFESLRAYVPGDELRRVDWKASARRGKLISRQYQLERGQNLMLLLDAGRTMASRGDALTKLDYAVNAALLLSYVAVEQADRVGLLAFAEEVVAHLPLGKGEAQKRGVMETLYALKHRYIESDYRRAFLFAATRLRKRSLVVLFTDLIDPDSSARLIANVVPLVRKHLVLCVALNDTESIELLHAVPQDAPGAYQQAAAVSILEDRKKALAQLNAHGVLTLDVSPQQLSTATVNRYLQLKVS